jgi:hypothetical protein
MQKILIELVEIQNLLHVRAPTETLNRPTAFVTDHTFIITAPDSRPP